MAEIVVVGASLGGIAVAARLAKVGHRVRLFDAVEQPAPIPDQQLICFPAPWRDLFRKTGRTLEAELDRRKLTLVPAPARVSHGFELPTERGAQYAAVAAAYGEQSAVRWRDLLDRLDEVWDAARWLGVELELEPERLKAAKPQLLWGRTVEDLARYLDHPVLSEVVRDTAADPGRTPARLAMWLAVERKLCRWQLQDRAGAPAAATTWQDLLFDRLATRRVELCFGQRLTDTTGLGADAVVLAVDPPDALILAGRAQRRALAKAARVWTPAGPRWRGERTWSALPGSRLGAGVYTCGRHTRAGTNPAAQLLSGALAAYAVHLDLTGVDLHPTKSGKQNG